MIDKREIIDNATALGLNPHVVEKDYVLGWLLWGIRNHRAVRDSWTFKGGTCLKKCFFETYRFSEDFDFTLDDPAHVDGGFRASVVSEITERIYEETGIEFPPDVRRFDVYENPRGLPLPCCSMSLDRSARSREWMFPRSRGSNRSVPCSKATGTRCWRTNYPSCRRLPRSGMSCRSSSIGCGEGSRHRFLPPMSERRASGRSESARCAFL